MVFFDKLMVLIALIAFSILSGMGYYYHCVGNYFAAAGVCGIAVFAGGFFVCWLLELEFDRKKEKG